MNFSHYIIILRSFLSIFLNFICHPIGSPGRHQKNSFEANRGIYFWVTVYSVKCISIPHICHEPHEHICVNFFWPVKIFTDLTRKIGIFDRFTRKSGVFFFTDLTRKIGVFRCKFYSPKILPG